MKNFRNTVGSLKKLEEKSEKCWTIPRYKIGYSRTFHLSKWIFFFFFFLDTQSSNLESKVNSILVAGDLRLYRNVDSKKKKKKKFILEISQRWLQNSSQNTMQIGIAPRRVGSHYLASFRLETKEEKKRGRKRKRKKEKGRELGRSPEPRSIFLRAISSFTVDQPTLYARAFSPDGSIRRMRKRIATGSYPSPSPRPSLPSCPFCAPDRGSYSRRSARWGRIIHRPRARSRPRGTDSNGGNVARRLGAPCPLASILHPMYRRVDEMVNRRAVEACGGGGGVETYRWRSLTEMGRTRNSLFFDEWKKIGARRVFKSCFKSITACYCCYCGEKCVIVSY